MLHLFGVSRIDWQAGTWSSWLAISLIVTWRWTGYNALIYLASMQAIPFELYESAAMDGASRLFHLDPEDFTQVRMFLNVIDIRREQGPLTFLPADVSDTALARLWRDDRKNRARKPELRRWTDEEILTRAGMSPCIELVGPSGSGAFVDTSRCAHFGSRMKPGTHHLVFQAQFLRYHFPFATATNRFDRGRAGRDPVLSRLLVDRPGFVCNWHDR